mmetsp:Transcript_115432/g.326246  ORF Transcript_115432/g.326246 Transcript_115432/m.326246 type:complete len:285 (+) Transcript_115432:1040-1894(+)
MLPFAKLVHVREELIVHSIEAARLGVQPVGNFFAEHLVLRVDNGNLVLHFLPRIHLVPVLAPDVLHEGHATGEHLVRAVPELVPHGRELVCGACLQFVDVHLHLVAMGFAILVALLELVNVGIRRGKLLLNLRQRRDRSVKPRDVVPKFPYDLLLSKQFFHELLPQSLELVDKSQKLIMVTFCLFDISRHGVSELPRNFVQALLQPAQLVAKPCYVAVVRSQIGHDGLDTSLSVRALQSYIVKSCSRGRFERFHLLRPSCKRFRQHILHSTLSCHLLAELLGKV